MTLLEMTGDAESTIEDALSQWQKERESMRELYAENEAYRILNRRLVVVAEISERVFSALEGEGNMFLSVTVQQLIVKARSQIEKSRNALLQSKELNDEKAVSN